MPLLPYCAFEPDSKIPEMTTGVLQSPILSLTEGGLSALYSVIPALPSEAGELAQAAMSFQSTVQQVFGACAVIPFRFPSLLKEESDLRAHLRDHAEAYKKSLGELRGLAQMEIRITRLGGAPPASTPQTGTEFLKSRQEGTRALSDASAMIREAAGDLVREWIERDAGGVARSYALVEHASAPEFKRRVGFVRLSGGTRAVVSGPWPPSEFIAEKER